MRTLPFMMMRVLGPPSCHCSQSASGAMFRHFWPVRSLPQEGELSVPLYVLWVWTKSSASIATIGYSAAPPARPQRRAASFWEHS
jgi:hypothetical protein